MKFGLRYASLGRFGKGPAAIELAQAAEEAGFDSIWTVEHVVIPRAYQSRYPYSASGRMGEIEDFPIPDPLIWMAYVAGATSRIKLGTAILIVPQRNPVAAGHVVEGGQGLGGHDRVLLGIGVGWLAEEFAALGIPFDDRGPRTDDYVAAMRTLWSEDCATYEGPFASFRDVYCKPRPPGGRIPVIVGGDSRSAARRAGRLGDGYFPARGNPVELYGEMRRAAEAAGRDPDGIEISAAAPADPAGIADLERSGVGRVMVPVTGAAGLPPLVKNPEEVLRYGREVIDRYGAA